VTSHSEHSDQLDALAAALSEAQAEFTAIPKTETNPFFKSKFAGLPQVVKAASPILTKHGLSVTQHIGYDDRGDTLATWLLHKSGQFICDTMRLHSAPAKGLSEVQGQGSATTYSRRYAYMAVLGLVADEDDDGQTAPKRAQQRQATNGGEVKLATEKDVETLELAAKDLAGPDIKLVLGACGLDSVTAFRMVPATKVVEVAKALSKASA
jgi:hypothetical protein